MLTASVTGFMTSGGFLPSKRGRRGLFFCISQIQQTVLVCKQKACLSRDHAQNLCFWWHTHFIAVLFCPLQFRAVPRQRCSFNVSRPTAAAAAAAINCDVSRFKVNKSSAAIFSYENPFSWCPNSSAVVQSCSSLHVNTSLQCLPDIWPITGLETRSI